ncbi:S41 family peptidase [Candidatus Gracilibacteria bacterium]|nr:S41 family peptidase [Candidatus Gracilibacteria bacterium]
MTVTKTKPNKSFAQLFIIILTSFLLGVLFSDHIGNLFVKNSVSNEVVFSKKSSLDMTKFWEVYDVIGKEYLGGEKVPQQKVIDGAISGMVDALGDKHSVYLDPEETQSFNNVLSGDFEGIGAVVEKVDLGVIIDRLIKGSPAKLSGLRKGDVVIKANEFELEGLSLYDAVDKIKGPAGTKVLLTVLRSGERDVLEIEITRQKIKIPSVESELLDENIGYISLNLFGDKTSEDFEKVLNELSDASGLIIDLRDNGGGYLQSAVEILSNFVPDGEVLVSTSYKRAFSNKSYSSNNDGETYNKKIVILINENSASASEITAGALREYDKAILVGKKSYGKGSVQEPFFLGDDSMLKLTIAEWLTPKKNKIDGQGIEPDIEIDFKDEDFPDLETGGEFYDRQLEEAKKVLQLFQQKEFIGVTVSEYEGNVEEK